MRFLYPPRMEKYILKTIGDRWRQHKSNLKAIYFDEKKSTKANYNNKPNSVTPDQWRSLVNHWTTQKTKVLKIVPFPTFLVGLYILSWRYHERYAHNCFDSIFERKLVLQIGIIVH